MSSGSALQRRTLEEVGHRPWPLPDRRWLQGQTWCDLLFAHWRVPAEELRRVVPPPLPLHLDAEGSAWDEGTKQEPSHAPAATLGLHRAPPPTAALGLHDRLARLEQRGLPAAELTAIRADLDALEAKLASEGR